MRQSPHLLALLTISATLGFASQARGESLLISSQETDAHTVGVAELTLSEDKAPDRVEAIAPPTLSSVATLEAPSSPRASLPALDSEILEESAAVAEETPAAEGAESLAPSSSIPSASVHQLSQQPEEESDGAVSPESDPSDVLREDEVLDGESPSTPEVESPDVADPPDILDIDIDESFEESGEGDAAEDEESAEPGAVDEMDPSEDESEAEATDEETDEEGDQPGGLDVERAPQETQVLVAEVAVTSPEGQALSSELEDTVYDTIDTTPGETTTRSQLQRDINSIFATGFFANVRAVPSDTPLGVRVTFLVEPNPVLSRVEVEGDEVLPDEVVDDIFSPQYGEIINLLDFQDGIVELNEWYQQNGYVLAQVIAAPEIQDDGVVTLQVAEGVIEDIEIKFITEEGLDQDEDGNPIRGKTREFIITREFETQPGDVFQQNRIQSDLQRVFGLGIFDDVNLTLNPGKEDPRKVNVTVNVVERSTGSVAAGLGFNFTGDLFGTVSYRQDNFGGNNQKFSAETQLSTGGDILFDISFTDPWIAGDPYRTSYTVNAFARRSVSLVFEGGDNEINLPLDDDDDDEDDGDRVRVQRLGGGVSFRRPLSDTWSASLGTLYQRVRTTDSDGDTATEDAAGNPLTFSGDGADDLWTVQFGVVQDLRNDAFTPTSGSVLRLGTEQSIPLGSGNIFFNRLRASYSYYIPVSFINFNEGPQALAFNVQGGTIIGDLPPYEAFALGGTNSVRGYEEGEVGAGRSYLQASVEYRFPLFSFLGGAIFVDAATDLGSGSAVPGSPGPDRDKPGSGFGVGAGVRIQTPLGPIRIDYGLSDQGDGRLHFGIGERF
ncbi:MAG: BamA/TamA family outer membrane protein [Cyanobacteria bacterium P01_F01_bin.86]